VRKQNSTFLVEFYLNLGMKRKLTFLARFDSNVYFYVSTSLYVESKAVLWRQFKVIK